MINEMALREDFLTVPLFFLVSIIRLILYAQISFMCRRRCIILAIDSVVK